MITACLLLLIQGCATTPPTPTAGEKAHAEAKAAYLANDYQRTLAIVEPMAIDGEAWAQYTLGYMYYYGRGVALDREMAKQWIQRSAEQGYAPAQQALLRISSSTPKKRPEDATESPSKPQTPVAPQSMSPATTVTPENASSQDTTAAPMSAAATTPTEPPPVASAPQSPASASPPQQTAPGASSSQDMKAKSATAEPASSATTAPPQATPPEPSATPTKAMPASKPAPAKTAKTGQKNGIKRHAWIAVQDPQHFTVQLVSGGNEAAVIRFIHKHGLEKEAAYYETTRNGKPWFTVIYGSFTSRDAARQALRRLPASLSNASPWLRTFRAINKQLGP